MLKAQVDMSSKLAPGQQRLRCPIHTNPKASDTPATRCIAGSVQNEVPCFVCGLGHNEQRGNRPMCMADVNPLQAFQADKEFGIASIN